MISAPALLWTGLAVFGIVRAIPALRHAMAIRRAAVQLQDVALARRLGVKPVSRHGYRAVASRALAWTHGIRLAIFTAGAGLGLGVMFLPVATFHRLIGDAVQAILIGIMGLLVISGEIADRAARVLDREEAE